MKLLLTGFEPFGGEKINPSWEVVQQVSAEGVEGVEIVTKLLPTVFGRSIDEVIRTIDEENLIWSFPLARLAGALRLRLSGSY